MLELKGAFAKPGSAYAEAFGLVQQVGVFDDIIAATNTTLLVRDGDLERTAETRMFVGGVDTEATTHAAWLTEGVQSRPTTIQIHMVGEPPITATRDAQTRLADAVEVLVHEWCLHGDKFWTFIKGMHGEAYRGTSKLSKLADLYHDAFPAAATAFDLPEHRALAENTHAYFHMTLHTLKDSHPTLAGRLLAAWQRDVDGYAPAARPGHKATVAWGTGGVPPVRTEPRKPRQTASPFDREVSKEEQDAFADFFSDNESNDEHESKDSHKSSSSSSSSSEEKPVKKERK
ncbi:hypothetical protein [Yinghuangia seranimata]|uniref:hypothetical protein n=1 Tax=Yinghuangia seranimata TaxID=408067 RepID=UPI00248AAA7C|nr:hypothetical protein [Yinghuangia seranimata]MDI2125511.1 hypothetical protein [Yinghuangia seranimata]